MEKSLYLFAYFCCEPKTALLKKKSTLKKKKIQEIVFYLDLSRKRILFFQVKKIKLWAFKSFPQKTILLFLNITNRRTLVKKILRTTKENFN